MFNYGSNALIMLNNCFIRKVRFSSCSCLSKNNMGREANFMKKLLINKNSKKKYYQEDRSPKNVQTVINDPISSRRTPLRVSVLNKLFMTHITDILATGEISSDFTGRGMEVTNVSVNRDYHLVKVYWLAKSQEDEAWLDSFLPKVSHTLRHELSQLHLMGSVPRIQFILDKKNSQLASIDALITSCDKGPESDSVENDELNQEDVIPVMTNNVYGLQYDSIVSKLMVSINKAKAPHRKKDILPAEPNMVSDNINLSSKYSQKESIRKFLLLKRLNQQRRKDSKELLYDIHNSQENMYDDTEVNTNDDIDIDTYDDTEELKNTEKVR